MNAPRLFRPDDGPDELTVAEVCRSFIEHRDALHAAGLLSHAARKKHRYLEQFAREMDKPVSQCRRQDLLAFLGKHPEWVSPHTKHEAAALVVTCFRWAAEGAELIGSCPYRKPKELPVPQPRTPITAAEVRRVLESGRGAKGKTAERFRMLLWFLWETGFRTCEVYRLDWSQYDPEARCFIQKGKSTRRTGQDRILALPRRAARLVRYLRHRAGAPRSGPVFVNGRGGRWQKDRFNENFRKHARAAGLRPGVTAYSCRHGFTCARLEAGVGERQLADYLGHASTKYVGYYGKAVKSRIDYLRRAADGQDGPGRDKGLPLE